MTSSTSGARFLFFTQLGMLAMSLLDIVYFQFIAPIFGLVSVERAVTVSEAIWAVASLVTLGAIAMFTFERPAEERGLGFFALGAAAIVSAWSWWALLVPRVGHDEPFLHAELLKHALTSVVILGLNVSVWFLAARAAGEVSSGLTATYVFFCGIDTLMSLGFTYAALQGRSLFGTESMQLVIWSRTGLWLTHDALLLWVLWRAAFAATQASTPVPGKGPATATRDLVVGGTWLAAGLLVTVGSFALASSGGGGRYLITTGAIAYGLGRVIRGLARSGKADGATG